MPVTPVRTAVALDGLRKLHLVSHWFTKQITKKNNKLIRISVTALYCTDTKR